MLAYHQICSSSFAGSYGIDWLDALHSTEKRSDFYQVLLFSVSVLVSGHRVFVRFYLVISRYTRIYLVLLGFIDITLYKDLLGFIGFYWVLLGFTGFYYILLGFIVSLGCTGF